MTVVQVMLTKSHQGGGTYLLQRVGSSVDRHRSFLRSIAPLKARFTADEAEAMPFGNLAEVFSLVENFPVLAWAKEPAGAEK